MKENIEILDKEQQPQSLKDRLKRILNLIIIVGQIISFSLVFRKAILNPGKTSMPVHEIGMSCFLFAIIIFFWQKNDIKSKEVSSIMAFLLFILLGLNIFLFDYLNIIIEYEDWLKRGMP